MVTGPLRDMMTCPLQPYQSVGTAAMGRQVRSAILDRSPFHQDQRREPVELEVVPRERPPIARKITRNASTTILAAPQRVAHTYILSKKTKGESNE